MKAKLLIFCIIFSLKLVAQSDIQKKIQTQLILAENGAIVELDEGTFQFTSSLSMDDKNLVVIRGKGMDKTILSFKSQTDGAEGISN